MNILPCSSILCKIIMTHIWQYFTKKYTCIGDHQQKPHIYRCSGFDADFPQCLHSLHLTCTFHFTPIYAMVLRQGVFLFIESPLDLRKNTLDWPGAAVEPTVCNRKVPGSSSSLCTFVWVRLGAKDNPSPDPAQCGKPTALGTPFFLLKLCVPIHSGCMCISNGSQLPSPKILIVQPFRLFPRLMMYEVISSVAFIKT